MKLNNSIFVVSYKMFSSQTNNGLSNLFPKSRLRGSGHAIAAARMDAKLNAAGWISEQMGGVSYLEFLQDLEKRVDQEWLEISSSLEEIRSSLLSREGCLVNMTAEGKIITDSAKFLTKFIDELPSTSSTTTASWNASLLPVNEAIVVPTQVNYVGKAADVYQTGYQLHGSAYVISKYIGNTWLWDRVRVSGGVFSYLSYRDPNLLKTLDVYDGTSNFIRGLELDNDTLAKAIIGTIGDVDAYQLPDAKGYSSLVRYLLGITEEERQKRREEILSTSLKDFKEFAEVIEVVKDNGVVVAVASPDDVAKANELKDGEPKSPSGGGATSLSHDQSTEQPKRGRTPVPGTKQPPTEEENRKTPTEGRPPADEGSEQRRRRGGGTTTPSPPGRRGGEDEADGGDGPPRPITAYQGATSPQTTVPRTPGSDRKVRAPPSSLGRVSGLLSFCSVQARPTEQTLFEARCGTVCTSRASGHQAPNSELDYRTAGLAHRAGYLLSTFRPGESKQPFIPSWRL
ncbi:hypothetical protein Taro_011786 [Colocasia esculenta]|uniref:Uncharacterized protein n=1 Tax=Colocasia esculenta TaxID=4460 RepID=A0A843UH64_COLES|nr:hypothetical protein [Colocasia esculenta]